MTSTRKVDFRALVDRLTAARAQMQEMQATSQSAADIEYVLIRQEELGSNLGRLELENLLKAEAELASAKNRVDELAEQLERLVLDFLAKNLMR